MASTQGVPFTEALNKSPIRGFQWLTAFVCMLILVSDGMDLQLLGIVAPLVMADFGVDAGTFGIAMGAALVGFGLGAWGGGWLGDTIGRRYTLAIAAVIFSFATIGAGGSEGVWSMAFWRLIGGLGFGGAYANALTMASEWMPDRWRPVTVSTLSVGTPVGGTIVGWLGPDLAATRGWDGTFVVFGLATLAVVVIILVALRDSPSFLLGRGRTEAAHRNAALVLREKVQLVPDRHESDGGTAGAVGLLHSSFMRLNLGIALAFAAATMVAYGILSWSTTFLTSAGWTLNDAGNAVSVAGLTSMVGSIAAGVLVRHFGSRLVMATLSATLVVIMIALGWAVETLPPVPEGGDITLVTVLIGAAGAIFSASIASMYVIMALGYPARFRSAGIGFGIFMSRVGAVGATLFGGALLDFGEGSVVPYFTVLTISAAVISAAAVVVDRHVPPARSAAPQAA